MTCRTPAPRRLLRYTLVVGVLAALLAAAVVAALALGSVRIPPGQVIDILTGRADASPFRTIVLDVRLPRVLLGIVVGAGLAVIGTVLQPSYGTSSPTRSSSASPPAPPPARSW